MRKIELTQEYKDKFENLPEHGMGYQKVIVYLKNGMSFYTTIYNSMYIDLNEPVNMDQIDKINLKT